jgi:hypothetical protein
MRNTLIALSLIATVEAQTPQSIAVLPSPYASATEKMEAELELLKKKPSTWQNMDQLRKKYTELYQSTGDRQYLIAQIAAIEKYRAAFLGDQQFLYSLAGAIDRLDQDPHTAIRLYRDHAAMIGWENRLQSHYLSAMRVEFYHPGAMSTDALAAFFQAWTTDIDSLKLAIADKPKDAHWHRLLEQAPAEYHLWGADVELARGGDAKKAHQWLEKADAHFDIYIHPRAELRLGDIAARRDDRQTAQLHYHTAWNLLARHEEAWSRDLFYVYPDLRELHKLGNLIKSRVE